MAIDETRLQAQNENTAPEILTQLASSEDKLIRQYVASNPNTPLATLAELGKEFTDEIVANPIFDLLLLENPDSDFVRLSLARCSTTSTKTLEKLAESNNNDIGLAIVNHKNASNLALEKLATTQYRKKQFASFYLSILNRSNISPQVIHLVALNCGYYSVFRSILKKSATSRTTLEKFICFKDFIIDDENYSLLVRHTNISHDILNCIDYVRNNPDISQGILDNLSRYVPLEIGDSIFPESHTLKKAVEKIKKEYPESIVNNPILILLLIRVC